MKLIVGLGNIGKEYENTRHNIGFMVIDNLAKSLGEKFSFKAKFKGEIILTSINNQDVILLKPSTYMNLSGESILAVKQFYNINIDDILVIYDDLDLPCGKVRFRQKGSAGGHNGLKSIISCINSENFHRLKIGIDRDEKISVINYVLGKFSKSQIDAVISAIAISQEAIHDYLTKDIIYVMNKYN